LQLSPSSIQLALQVTNPLEQFGLPLHIFAGLLVSNFLAPAVKVLQQGQYAVRAFDAE
jgi:hypothetical protein